MTRRNVPVRKHLRRLPSGKKTQVVKHTRNIHSIYKRSGFEKLFGTPLIFDRLSEVKVKKALGLKLTTLLEYINAIPPPDRAEIKREFDELRRQKAGVRKIDVFAFNLQRKLAELRPLEEKFGRIPIISITPPTFFSPQDLQGEWTVFDFGKKKFMRVKLTPDKITRKPLFPSLHRRKG